MAHFSIISSQGQHPVLFTGAPRYVGAYLKPGYLEFPEIGSPTAIGWHVGDYVVYSRTGRTYRLYGTPKATEQSDANKFGAAFLYENVQFFDDMKQWELCPFTDLVPDDNTVHFSTQGVVSFFGKPLNVAERLQACLENQYGANSWEVRIVETSDADILEILNTEVEFSVSGVNCLQVLDKVYETWNKLGWAYTIENGKNILTIGAPNDRTAANTTEGYAYDDGLVAVEKSIANAAEIGTRLFAYGSMKNMDATYYRGLDIYQAESVDIEHLMIPISNWGTTSSKPDARKAYIQDATAIAKMGIIPRTAYFDGTGDLPDIHPTIERMTIGEVYDAGGAGYLPDLNEWSRDQRIDEIIGATNPSDEGAASDMGVRFKESISDTFDAVTEVGSANDFIEPDIYTTTLTKSGRLVLKFGRNIQTITLNAAWDARFNVATMEVANGNTVETIPLNIAPVSSSSFSFVLPEQVVIQNAVAGTLRVGLNIFVLDNAPTAETDTVTIAIDGDTTIEGGVEYMLDKTFSVVIPQIGFDIEKYAALGEGKKISMKTGMCAGRDFEIKEVNYQIATDSWHLTLYRSNDEDLNILFPNTDYQIASGDQFVLLDIAMPEMYVTVASQRLLEAAQKLLADICEEKPFYAPQIDAKAVVDESRVLLEGLWMDISFNGTQEYALIDSITIDENGSNIPIYDVALRQEKGLDWTENIGSASSGRSSVSVSGNESSEVRGTVTSVGLTAPEGLNVSGSPVTTAGILGLSLAPGYKIPRTEELAQYFELGGSGDPSGFVRLKSEYNFLGPRKGLIFDAQTSRIESNPPDLYVRTIDGQRVLYSPLPLITEGDQIVLSGTPGGGGGSNYLRLLEDVYHNESGVRRYASGNVGSTDLLAYDSTKGWYAVQLGSGLSLSNGVLTASGGGGGTSYTSGTVEELNAGSGTVDRVWAPSVLASWLSGKDYVMRTTAQTITAAHTFSNGLKLNTASSSWTNSDRALYFGANGDDANLRYYNVDADKGLTYNPNTGALKAGSFVKRGGTSAQFLKADGSVDSNTYLTTSSAADTYVLKAGDTMTGDLTIKKSGGGALNIQGSTHNAASGEIVFNPHGTQIRNGAKISAVAGSTSYDLIDIVFSASNNRTSPYSPDWYETLRIKYDKSVILANAGILKWMNNPSEGDPTAIDCIKLTSGNIFIIGRGVANNSYDSYLEGKSVYIRTGTSTLTSRLSVSQSAITMSLDTIPNVDNNYKLGNANRYWKELYTKKVYLADGIYIEYVDNSGNGYVHINAPLVTDGDQIVLSGTPGGGGGGASFLADLNDVTLTNLANTNLLQWNGNAWVNVAASSVGVTTEGTEANLNAGTPSTDKMVWAPATLASWLANKEYSTTANTVSNVAVGGSGHTTELAITKAGSTSYITVPFATMTERPKYVTPTQSADAIDLNTILAGGGITRNVWNQGYWNHAPSGIGYFGAAWQINAHSSETGAMQFAWNGNYTGTTPTKSLWFRVRNSEQWGDDWHLIYDSANLTKSVITGLLDAGNGTYLPLSGGTMTGSINMTDGKQIMDSTGTWAMLGLSSTGVFYCGPGYQVSSAFLIRSGDMDLKHRRYTSNTASGYNEYTIFDEANANLLSVSWSALNLTAAGTLTASGLATLSGGISTTMETASGTITALNFALSATNASSKIVFAREGYNYLQIPANGQLNVVANSSLSAANSTAIFTATDIRPGSNGGYNLGYVDSSSADNNRLWNVYAQEMMLIKANGPTLTLRGTGDNTDGATILFKSSSANHNGFKIAVEKAASSNNRGRLALNFYSSNVTTDPYEPDWKRAMRVSYNGNVLIGASDFSNTLYAYGTAVIGSATAISGATLSVTGVIASTGDQVVTSDIRMKTNLKPIELSVEQIAKCRAVTFDWTTGGHSFGSVAQDWLDILPEAVHKGNTLSLAYAQLGTVIGITLANHETEQDTEIRELKERVKYLEEEVKRLRS